MVVMRRRTGLAGARKAAGHTQESLAAVLHIDRSTVIRWEAGEHAPLPYLRPRLARLLGQSPDQLRALIGDDPGARPQLEPLNGDVEAACGWLDQQAGWSPGTSQRKVMAQLSMQGERAIHRQAKRSRSDIVHALSRYYRDKNIQNYDLYRVCCDGRDIVTSIVTRPEWLDLACPLATGRDRLTFVGSVPGNLMTIEGIAAQRALRRLIEVAAMGVRLTNAPIYRLLNIDAQRGSIDGTVGLASFVEYALTIDLLEGELLDAMTDAALPDPDSLPLRDRYLPDLDTVLDPPGRLCAGGVLALCAIARPADPYRGKPDYVVLVQERSGHVLNAAGQLSVIPKGFHQPLADYRCDAQLSATALREMEKELFGRSDIDNTVSPHIAAAPMHPNRLSEPMRWLTTVAGALRMECTGFGLNLVSGNYEFASLIVIDDEKFWHRYGGHIEANWETAGLRLYSSLDRELLAELIGDERWGNEGLFALLLGLRRLGEVGKNRVNLPEIMGGARIQGQPS